MKAVLRALRGNLRSHHLQRGLVFLTLCAAAGLLVLALGAYFTGFRVYDRLLARTHGAHIWLSASPRMTSPEEVMQAVRANPEVVESTEPLATFYATLETAEGKKERVLVRDLDPRRSVARLLWVAGREPKPRSREIALDRNLARTLKLRPGDQVHLWLGKQPSTLTVVGTFVTSAFCAYPNCKPPRVYLGPQTLAAAMKRAGVAPASWDVGIRVRDPQRAEEVLRALRGALPSGAIEGYTWLEVRRYVGFDLQMQSVFMLVFAVMAVAVAGFLIANAVAGAVRAQARQIGLLRALGFTNAQLAWVYLGEYLLVGLAAALVGLGIGLPLAGWVFAPVAERYAAAAPPPPMGVLPLPLAVILGGVALAAAWPLRRIGRLDTVTMIRRGAEPPRRRGVRLLRLPFPLAYGLSGLLTTPQRTALTTLGLTVGALAMVVALSLGATVRAFARQPVALGLVPAADVYLVAEGKVTPAALQAALEDAPEVVSYACERRSAVRVQGEDRDLYPRIVSGDIGLYANMLLEGRLPQTPDEAAAAYTIAHQHGWRVGDTVTLIGGGRPYTFRIVGIYRDLDNLGQMFILPGAAFPGQPFLCYARLTAGVAPHAFLDAFRQRLGGQIEGGVVAEEFQEGSNETPVDMLQTTVWVLSLILGLLTAVGVLSSLSLSVAEERRTVAVLKALGMTPGQVMVAVGAGAVAMALVGYGVGTPLGVLTAQVLFSALAKRVGLGPIPVPVDGVGVTLLLPGLMGMAALGAYLPARRAARLPVAEVLREE